MKRKIGIDLDDTLTDSLTKLIAYYNATFGTHLKPEDFTTLKFHKVWGGTGEEAVKIVNAFQHSHYFLEISPVLDSVESTRVLSKESELFVITARHEERKEETERWLDKFFRGIFSGVYYSANHYTRAESLGGKKADLCRDLGISVLIDDSIDYVMQTISAGIDAILFGDYGWNRDSHLPPELRCKNWKEVLLKLR